MAVDMSLEYFLKFLFFWSELPPSTACCRHVVIVLIGVRICHILRKIYARYNCP